MEQGIFIQFFMDGWVIWWLFRGLTWEIEDDNALGPSNILHPAFDMDRIYMPCALERYTRALKHAIDFRNEKIFKLSTQLAVYSQGTAPLKAHCPAELACTNTAKLGWSHISLTIRYKIGGIIDCMKNHASRNWLRGCGGGERTWNCPRYAFDRWIPCWLIRFCIVRSHTHLTQITFATLHYGWFSAWASNYLPPDSLSHRFFCEKSGNSLVYILGIAFWVLAGMPIRQTGVFAITAESFPILLSKNISIQLYQRSLSVAKPRVFMALAPHSWKSTQVILFVCTVDPTGLYECAPFDEWRFRDFLAVFRDDILGLDSKNTANSDQDGTSSTFLGLELLNIDKSQMCTQICDSGEVTHVRLQFPWVQQWLLKDLWDSPFPQQIVLYDNQTTFKAVSFSLTEIVELVIWKGTFCRRPYGHWRSDDYPIHSAIHAIPDSNVPAEISPHPNSSNPSASTPYLPNNSPSIILPSSNAWPDQMPFKHGRTSSQPHVPERTQGRQFIARLKAFIGGRIPSCYLIVYGCSTQWSNYWPGSMK